MGASMANAKSSNMCKQPLDRRLAGYRRYRSASELVLNFERDLTSAAAKKVDAESRALRLPTIEDIRDEFKAKAPALGVEGS
jgi:hypothetical protein